MNSMFLFNLICLVIFLLVAFSATTNAVISPGSDIQTPKGYILLKTGTYGSSLYSIDVPDSTYSTLQPMLINLTAKSHYEQGFDTGLLLGAEFILAYNNLLLALLGDEKWEPAAVEIINKFIDWQWRAYMSKQLPIEYNEELRGLTEGGKKGNYDEDVGLYAKRCIVMTNLPGSLENLKFIFQDEGFPKLGSDDDQLRKDFEPLINKLNKNYKGFACSMFGVWGSRTKDGKLYSGRNLDWLTGTGLSTNKLITVHHPPNGYSHATVGWAGVWGAIAGMSSQGLTVHEANLESDDITFQGFPWILRLRHIMTNAKNLNESLNLWAATNNTVGFNHAIGSASDNQSVALETMKSNTAIFYANDMREQNQIVNGENIGQPRPEAIYRTNHGYDQYTIENFMWNGTHAYNNSIYRYLLFPTLFDGYQTTNTIIAETEAVSITAIVSDKGEDQTYDCTGPFPKGDSVLSVTFDPSEQIMYAAWESNDAGGNANDKWVPAACQTYIKLDMKEWF